MTLFALFPFKESPAINHSRAVRFSKIENKVAPESFLHKACKRGLYALSQLGSRHRQFPAAQMKKMQLTKET
jgi:hypothetical protein